MTQAVFEAALDIFAGMGAIFLLGLVGLCAWILWEWAHRGR